MKKSLWFLFHFPIRYFGAFVPIFSVSFVVCGDCSRNGVSDQGERELILWLIHAKMFGWIGATSISSSGQHVNYGTASGLGNFEILHDLTWVSQSTSGTERAHCNVGRLSLPSTENRCFTLRTFKESTDFLLTSPDNLQGVGNWTCQDVYCRLRASSRRFMRVHCQIHITYKTPTDKQQSHHLCNPFCCCHCRISPAEEHAIVPQIYVWYYHTICELRRGDDRVFSLAAACWYFFCRGVYEILRTGISFN